MEKGGGGGGGKIEKEGGKKREKKDFKQEMCCPCHFSVSPAPLWGWERIVCGDGTGGAGTRPGRGITASRKEVAARGGKAGEQGTGCCTNLGPVLEEMAARLWGRERDNLPCMGQGLGWPLLANC